VSHDLQLSVLPRGARTTRPGAERAACAAAWATVFMSVVEFIGGLGRGSVEQDAEKVV
jgi:hypothetical protein